MKGRPLLNLFLAAISVFLVVNFVFCEDGKETILNIKDIITANHALSGDTVGVKDEGEALYLVKGETIRAMTALKEILIEHKRAARSFKTRDPINLIIFRGVLQTFGKIEVLKIVSKDNCFMVYTTYLDIPDPKIPSEPAVIVPFGKLPVGKYSILLYVSEQLHKKAEFSVTR